MRHTIKCARAPPRPLDPILLAREPTVARVARAVAAATAAVAVARARRVRVCAWRSAYLALALISERASGRASDRPPTLARQSSPARSRRHCRSNADYRRHAYSRFDQVLVTRAHAHAPSRSPLVEGNDERRLHAPHAAIAPFDTAEGARCVSINQAAAATVVAAAAAAENCDRCARRVGDGASVDHRVHVAPAASAPHSPSRPPLVA